MGFEIEGCVNGEVRDDLMTYLCDIYPESNIHQLIHYDGSIYPKNRAIEIVTPALKEQDAIERLEWLLATLDILSEEGLFETNHTCGFHINISEGELFKKANNQIRSKFAFKFLTKLDPLKWKKAYGRTRGKANNYCSWAYGAPVFPEDVNDGVYANHYSAINTQHLHIKDAKARRIEVRVAGGKDYHRKYQ